MLPNIPTKAYILLGVIILILIPVWYLYSEHMELQEDLSKEKAKSSLLLEATNVLKNEMLRKDRIDIIREADKANITKKNKELQHALNKLKKTSTQIKCDDVPTADGYAEWVLKYSTN